MHINYRRGETRDMASEYPYSDATYNRFVQAEANSARRCEARRLVFAALATYEADQAQAAADAIEDAAVSAEASIETEGPMRLWQVTRSDSGGYDTYSHFVAAAPTEDLARRVHPSDYSRWDSAQRCFVYLSDDARPSEGEYGSWTDAVETLTVTEIGSAVEGMEHGTVLCASFHAG